MTHTNKLFENKRRKHRFYSSSRAQTGTTLKVRSYWASILAFASAFASNFNIVYGDVDIDAENGYRTHSLHLCFVTIASIIFENENADIDAKCEWAFTGIGKEIWLPLCSKLF